jgi:hypothetical protein
MNQWERASTLGCPALSVVTAESHQAERMDMALYTRECPTCLRPFQTFIFNKKYCRTICSTHKNRKDRQTRTTCHTCGHVFYLWANEARKPGPYYCLPSCKPLQQKSLPRQIQQRSHSFYKKDEELFAQRMAYTLDGMTWWATPCVYCGDPAEDEEHVLPLSAYKKLTSAGNIQIPDDLLRIVPSCHECNMLLGDKVFRSFVEKRLYTKAALARRYHNVVELPYWSIEELTEIEGRMHDWIAGGQQMRDMIFERLRF